MHGRGCYDDAAAGDYLMSAVQSLHAATEDDVLAALGHASFDAWPQDEAELLEFFMLMLDQKLGQRSSHTARHSSSTRLRRLLAS
jgi:hypothetical protein